MAKKLGATKIGSVGYGVSPSSSGVAKDTQKYAAPASGLKPVYLNTSVDFGSTDVGPIVLGLKNAGADAVYLPLDGNTNLAIAQGLQQNNVPMKAVLMASGYGQAMLDSPITKTLNSADVVSQIYKPAELKNDPAVKTVPGRPQEVRRHHRGPRLRRVHRLPRLRPGHHRPAAGGQEPDAARASSTASTTSAPTRPPT